MRNLAAAVVAMCVASLGQVAPRTMSIYVDSPLRWFEAMTTASPDFRLSIDGTPVEIVHAARGPQPVSAVVLFDVSGSMAAYIPGGRVSGLASGLKLDQAARRFASVARPGDRVRIGTFASKITIASTLLTDPQAASKAAREIEQLHGPSPVWDAVDRGLAALNGQPGVRAILVHTDGMASGNDIGSEEVLTRALRAGVSVSAVGLSDDALFRSGVQIIGRNDALLRLVRETGGTYFELRESNEQPTEYFAWTLRDLRQSYKLDFVPARDSRMHEVSVTVRGRPAKTARFVTYR